MLSAGQGWFDPQIGRWLSQDPIGFAGGLNSYGYTGQYPINFVDPSGLRPDWTSPDARREVYGEAFRETFSWKTLSNFANSMLEVLDLASEPKTKVTTAAIQAASSGDGQPCPVVAASGKKSVKDALKREKENACKKSILEGRGCKKSLTMVSSATE